MTTFLLVHGACEDGRCWQGVSDELALFGLPSVTVDLPCDDPTRDASDYADRVLETARHVDDDLVAVGHSLGGLTLPWIAHRRPLLGMVFVCAIIPAPRQSVVDQLEDDPGMTAEGYGDEREFRADGVYTWPVEAAERYFYHDCPPDDRRRALARLRGQAERPFHVSCPPSDWCSVPSAVVYAVADRALQPAWQRSAARRIGAIAAPVSGGHSPHISRPGTVASLLAHSDAVFHARALRNTDS